MKQERIVRAPEGSPSPFASTEVLSSVDRGEELGANLLDQLPATMPEAAQLEGKIANKGELDGAHESHADGELRFLLRRAGFRIRTAKRADCAYCRGNSYGTVSFNSQVAHCFRCGWAANRVTLARKLGLLTNDPTMRLRRQRSLRAVRIEEEIRNFEAWRETRIHQISGHLRRLAHAAIRADEVLRKFPECEQAWEALARHYHEAAKLSAQLDFLCFTKASMWLDADATSVEVFKVWRRSQNVTA